MKPEEVEALKAHVGQQQQPSLVKDIDTIIEMGRTHYSSAAFDEASQAVAENFEGNTTGLMTVLSGFDHPHDVIMHLANNPAEAKRLKGLSPQRQAIEIAKIEGRLNSSALVPTGAEPAYKQPALRSGRVSDEDWSRSFGEGLSEKQFDKEFWRRQESRNSRRR